MFEYKSNSPEMTAELAERIAPLIEAGTVICLNGDLGAGKTLFVQSLAASLGVVGEITSPTFNIMNVYEGRLPILHFDLYRLEEEYELEEIGFFDYVDEPEGIVLIEWAEKFPDCMPENYVNIEIERTDIENERCFTFSLHGSALKDMFEEMKNKCQF